MIKKIVMGTLVLIVLNNPSSAVYAFQYDNEFSQDTINAVVQELDIEEEGIKLEIISPKLGPDKTVVIDSNNKLLISTKVYSDIPVTISVYKVQEETEELLFDSEVIGPREDLDFTAYFKEIKDIEPGDYKMKFTKEDEEEPFKILDFKVRTTEEILNNEEKKNNKIPSFLDLLLDK